MSKLHKNSSFKIVLMIVVVFTFLAPLRISALDPPPIDSYYIVYTPFANPVTVWTYNGDLDSYEKEVYRATNTLNFPYATYISEATYNYNCHSYAWYFQSTSNPYWMGDPATFMNGFWCNNIDKTTQFASRQTLQYSSVFKLTS